MDAAALLGLIPEDDARRKRKAPGPLAAGYAPDAGLLAAGRRKRKAPGLLGAGYAPDAGPLAAGSLSATDILELADVKDSRAWEPGRRKMRYFSTLLGGTGLRGAGLRFSKRF